MNIKESFRYQNYLGNMIDNVCMYLTSKPNVTKVTEQHNREASNADAHNETIDATAERAIEADVSDILEFLYALDSERYLVSQRIACAKAESDFCLDAEVSHNRTLREISNTLHKMSGFKASERTKTGSAYKFNVEGNQVPYAYEIVQKIEPEFSIADTKRKANGFAKSADETSSLIDRFMIETKVDVTPVFDVTERFEDALASFIERKKGDENYQRTAV